MSESNVNRAAKRIFARLLANENIHVRHDPSAITATFDTDKRVLVLPVLNGMDDDVYDLFVGHEVGHALFTPAFSEQEMIDVMNRVSPNNLTKAKFILNCVEDARIERMIRAKYPGLGKNFLRGYNNLFQNGFFGEDVRTKSSSISRMNIVDRINLFYKLNINGIPTINPNDVEQEFISRIDNARSFEDVVQISKDLSDLLDQENNQDFSGEQEILVKSEIPVSVSGQGENDEENENSQGNQDQENDSEKESDKSNSSLQGSTSYSEKVFVSSTQNFEDGMKQYLKEKNLINTSIGYNYNSIPSPNLDRIIIPFDRIHDGFSKYISKRMSPETLLVNPLLHRENGKRWDSPLVKYDLEKETAEFLSSAKMATSTMAASFNRRMQAHISRRVQISKTGRLNMDIIHTYKYNDDLFMGSSFIPKGKNHGMIMFIDWSGSMQPYISQTIRQMMNLVIFCRSVKIPFQVFAFTDQSHKNEDKNSGEKFWVNGSTSCYSDDARGVSISPSGSPYCRMGDFHLMELFSSEMNTKQLNDAIRNMIFWGDCIGGKSISVGYDFPRQFGLGGTPLAECIISGISVARNFRKKYNCEILNTVFLTDGEGSGNNIVYSSHYPAITTKNIVEFEGRSYELSSYRYLDSCSLAIYRDATRSRVIGFYLTCPPHVKKLVHYRYPNPDDRNRIERDFKSDGFVSIKMEHYDLYYLMQANSETMSMTDVFDKVSNDGDTRKTVSEFVKSANSRAKSRILLNNFAEIVAQDIRI